MEQMGAGGNEEFVAYSVDYLAGRQWRWRVYRPDGAIACQGVEITGAAAERVAAALVFDTARERPSSPRPETPRISAARAPQHVTAYALISFLGGLNVLWMWVRQCA
jgi:hypothetical protein